MAQLHVSCECGNRLLFSFEQAGQRGNCRNCRREVLVSPAAVFARLGGQGSVPIGELETLSASADQVNTAERLVSAGECTTPGNPRRVGQIDDLELGDRLQEMCTAYPDSLLDECLLAREHLESGDREAVLRVLESIGPSESDQEIASVGERAERSLYSSGRCPRTFEEGDFDWVEGEWVEPVLLSADCRYGLSGGHIRTLQLWHTASGRCLRPLEGHSMDVTSVCLSTDSRYALSGSVDETIRPWFLDRKLEDREPADWGQRARPYLEAFLAQQTPYAAKLPEDRKPTEEEKRRPLARRGRPQFSEADFQRLLDRLGSAGYDWLSPEGVKRKLVEMAKTWTARPPLLAGEGAQT